jgi:hypothetical protein
MEIVLVPAVVAEDVHLREKETTVGWGEGNEGGVRNKETRMGNGKRNRRAMVGTQTRGGGGKA